MASVLLGESEGDDTVLEEDVAVVVVEEEEEEEDRAVVAAIGRHLQQTWALVAEDSQR